MSSTAINRKLADKAFEDARQQYYPAEKNRVLSATGYRNIRVVTTLLRGKVRVTVQDTMSGKVSTVFQQI